MVLQFDWISIDGGVIKTENLSRMSLSARQIAGVDKVRFDYVNQSFDAVRGGGFLRARWVQISNNYVTIHSLIQRK